MNPTPDIDIGELRRLEQAADAALNPRDEIMVMVAFAERDYWTALRNAAPALLAKWEECERLQRVNALLQSSEQQYADETARLKSDLASMQEQVNESEKRAARAEAVVSAAKALCGTKTMLEDASAKFGEIGNPYAAQVALHRDDQALRSALSTYEGKSE